MSRGSTTRTASLEEHAETADRVREAANRAGRPVAILQDLPGPKLRIGALADGVAELQPRRHRHLRVRRRTTIGDRRRMSVSWQGLARHSSRTRSSTSRTGRFGCAYARRALRRLRAGRARSRLAASSPRARGSTSRARRSGCPRSRGGPRPARARRVDRRRSRRAFLRALGRATSSSFAVTRACR